MFPAQTPFIQKRDRLLFDGEERVLAEILRDLVQLLLDAEQLIVLRNAVGAAGSTSLDLAGVQRDGDVGNGGILGLAGTMGDNSGVTGAVRHLDGVERLSQGADLVDLDEDRVGNLLLNAGGEAGNVGDEQVVADGI